MLVSVQMTSWRPPRRSASGPRAQVLHHLLGILVKEGVVLHYQETVVFLLQYGHELEEGVGLRISSSVMLRSRRLELRRLLVSGRRETVG